MSSKREDVSTSGTETDQNIGFTFEDLQEELRQYHEAARPGKQPGEFTAMDYATVNHLTQKEAESFISYQVRAGKMERVAEKRFVDGNFRKVYKLVIVTKLS